MDRHSTTQLPYLCNWCLGQVSNQDQAVFTDCACLFCSGTCASQLRRGPLCSVCAQPGCRLYRVGKDGSGLPLTHRRCLFASAASLIDEMQRALAFREAQLQRLRERILDRGVTEGMRSTAQAEKRAQRSSRAPEASVFALGMPGHIHQIHAAVSQNGSKDIAHWEAQASTATPISRAQQQQQQQQQQQRAALSCVRRNAAAEKAETPRSADVRSAVAALERSTQASGVSSSVRTVRSQQTVRSYGDRLERIREQMLYGPYRRQLQSERTPLVPHVPRSGISYIGRARLGLPPAGDRRQSALHRANIPGLATKRIWKQRSASASNWMHAPGSAAVQASSSGAGSIVSTHCQGSRVVSSEVQRVPSEISTIRPTALSMNPLHWLNWKSADRRPANVQHQAYEEEQQQQSQQQDACAQSVQNPRSASSTIRSTKPSPTCEHPSAAYTAHRSP